MKSLGDVFVPPNQGSLMSYTHHNRGRGANLTIFFTRKQGLTGLSDRSECLAMTITRLFSDFSLSIGLVFKT